MRRAAWFSECPRRRSHSTRLMKCCRSPAFLKHYQKYSPNEGGKKTMEKQKILIVDDSELVLAMARDALEESGYEVFTATNGIEANSYIFSKNRPDLIILDVMLPMLDGNKKAKLLRE